MRPLRPNPIRIAAAAAGVAALSALGAAVAPTIAQAAPAKSAQSEYQSALKAAGSGGVHFDSTAAQSGVQIHVFGDTGTTSGMQKLVVKNGKLTEQMTALVVGSTGYVNGNSDALSHVIGLTSSDSSKYAGTWLSFPTSTSGLNELVSGLLNSQVSSELQMSGPFTYGAATTVGGQHVLSIHGTVSTQSGGKVPTILYVAATGTPLPIEEVTNPQKSGGASEVHGTVTFSKWGEKTSERAPAHSVSLLTLVPKSSSSTTTTKG
jgi:hypothetical protein